MAALCVDVGLDRNFGGTIPLQQIENILMILNILFYSHSDNLTYNLE